jgi:hypothetical protein
LIFFGKIIEDFETLSMDVKKKMSIFVISYWMVLCIGPGVISQSGLWAKVGK